MCSAQDHIGISPSVQVYYLFLPPFSFSFCILFIVYSSGPLEGDDLEMVKYPPQDIESYMGYSRQQVRVFHFTHRVVSTGLISNLDVMQCLVVVYIVIWWLSV